MMRKLLYSFLFFIFLHSAVFGQTAIWSNQITTNNPNNFNPYTIGDTKDANITVSGIGRGPGITGVNANGLYRASGWATSNRNPNDNDYFEFTITPNSTSEINYASFQYNSTTNGDGPTRFVLRSSLDDYNTNIDGEKSSTLSNTFALGNLFQKVRSAITFRLYGYRADDTSGLFSIDNFQFNGEVTCVTNLIKNGDFSNGTNDWVRATTKGTTVEVLNEDVYFGTTNTTNRTAELDSEASLRQVVTVIPNVSYTLSFIYARRPGSPNNVAVDVKLFGGSTASINYTTSVERTPFVGTLTFTPTTSSVGIEFYNSLGGNSTLGSIVDNIVLLPSSFVSPIATTDPKGNFGTLSACAGVPIKLDVENVTDPNVTYAWTSTSPGAVFSSTTIKNPTITFTGSGIQNATVTVTKQGGCAGAPSTTYVNVKAAPAVYNVTGGGSYCSGGTGFSVNLSGSAASNSGVTYQLQLDGVDNGAAVAATGSAINFGVKTVGGTYTVIAKNAADCSLKMNGSAVITVNPNPTANAGTALAAICQGATSAQMGGSVGGGATGGTWTGGAGTWANATNPSTATYTAGASESGSITLRLTTSGGSCGTTFVTKTITVNPNPTANAGSALAAICQGAASAQMGGSVGGGATGGTWTGGAGTWANATNPSTATYTAGASESGSITLRLTTSGGSCGTTFVTKTITVNPNPTANAGSGLAAICQGAASAQMGGSVGGGATGGTWTGGAGTWANATNPSTATYTAGASESGSVTLRLTTSGGSCGTTFVTKTITVNPNNTITLNSDASTTAQTVCINNPITNIRYTTTGATNVTFSGLPNGVTGGWAGNVVTISGTPTESSATSFTYTVTLEGGCGNVTATGTIRVNPNKTITLNSDASTTSQTVCINNAITNIRYAITGATSVTFSGLPNGVTGSWISNVLTISGTPTVSSATPFSYTVTLGGGCGTAIATGTIRVNPNNAITLTSATGTDTQTVCANTAITDITYNTTGATGVDFGVLPDGLSGIWSGNVATITGTPTVSSATPYNYTVTLLGGCGNVSATGTITVKQTPTAPSITKNGNAACNTLGSITITGLLANWTVNQTGTTTLPKSYHVTDDGSLAIQDLVADTYYFTVTNEVNCTSSSSSVTITDTSSNTEWNGSGWSNDEPDGSKSVTISSVDPNQPFSTAKPNIAACSLTITAGADVIVPEGVTLTITNKVTSNGRLVFESGSSLLQTTNVQNEGEIVYRRATKINRFDLTYWSSPVTGETEDFKMQDLSPTTLFDKFFRFSPTGGWETNMYGTDPMKPGYGYSIRGPQEFDSVDPRTFVGEFTGRPNNGDITVPSVVPDKWFLLGNPYPSAIDVDALWDANQDKLGALYFWTHVAHPKKDAGENIYRYASNDYVVYTATGSTDISGANPPKTFEGYIAAGQGFFTRPKGTEIHFNNDMRRGASVNGNFFKVASKSKSRERNRIWLNMRNAEGAFKQILVGYIEGATNSVDFNYDAITLGGNSYVDFYSLNDTKKLTIQGRALPFDNTDLVPLGYKTTVAGDFTIGIDHGDGFFDKQEIYLEDKTTGKTTNLRNENYTFNTLAGTFADRFVLRYTGKTLGTDDLENVDNSVLISVKNKIVSIICSKETIKEVNIFNVGAQLLYSKNKVNSSELHINNLHSSDQVILVKVTLENGSIVTKKVIFSNL